MGFVVMCSYAPNSDVQDYSFVTFNTRKIILGSRGVDWSIVEFQEPLYFSCSCLQCGHNVVSEKDCDVCLKPWVSVQISHAIPNITLLNLESICRRGV